MRLRAKPELDCFALSPQDDSGGGRAKVYSVDRIYLLTYARLHFMTRQLISRKLELEDFRPEKKSSDDDKRTTRKIGPHGRDLHVAH